MMFTLNMKDMGIWIALALTNKQQTHSMKTVDDYSTTQ